MMNRLRCGSMFLPSGDNAWNAMTRIAAGISCAWRQESCQSRGAKHHRFQEITFARNARVRTLRRNQFA